MQRITIVGAGRVGETTAFLLAKANLCHEIVLLDNKLGVAKGAALDILQSAAIQHFDTKIKGTSNVNAMENSDLVIITAGIPRKPGMSRSDVLEVNLGVIDGILNNVMEYASNAKILMVTNPVDVLTYRAWQKTGWSANRIFGQAGILDAARMATFIAMETGCSVRDVTAFVLGGHGDAMVPLPQLCTINGIPLKNFLSMDAICKIIGRTRKGGSEILDLRQTSSAYYAPATAIVEIVESMVKDTHRLLPVVAILNGEYGQKNIAMGVPCIISCNGVKQVVELDLSGTEQAMFDTSVDFVRKDIDKLTNIMGIK